MPKRGYLSLILIFIHIIVFQSQVDGFSAAIPHKFPDILSISLIFSYCTLSVLVFKVQLLLSFAAVLLNDFHSYLPSFKTFFP